MSLHPCTSCHRHISVEDLRCPFCAEAVDRGSIRRRPLPTARLGRAALVSFGAAALANACSSETVIVESTDPVGVGGMGGGVTAGEGGSTVSTDGSGGFTTATSTTSGFGGVAPAYGSPSGVGGAGAMGGSSSSDGGAQPVYGAAPPPDDDGASE